MTFGYAVGSKDMFAFGAQTSAFDKSFGLMPKRPWFPTADESSRDSFRYSPRKFIYNKLEGHHKAKAQQIKKILSASIIISKHAKDIEQQQTQIK